MYRILKVIILLLFINSNPDVYSQRLRQLPSDPGELGSGLISFMGTNLTEEQTSVVYGFITLWDSTAFTPPEKERFLSSANHYLSRNARPVPHIINYLKLMAIFAEHDPHKGHLPIWQPAFESIVNREDMTLTQIDNFINTSANLISGKVLYNSSAVSWKAAGDNFRMEYRDSLRIVFGQSDLMAVNHTDTLVIRNTTGVMCPISLRWKGKGGRVTWERAGLDPQDTYAILDDYVVSLTRSEYSADSVLFTYGRYFNSPLSGRLTDRLMSSSGTASATFPRFTSYLQDFAISGIFSGVDYEGGLSMEGAKLIGSGGEQDNARLHFYQDGARWLTAESEYFVFRPQGTGSASTSILFFLENDSVFHPDMQMNYVDNNRELSISPNQNVISQSPWYNQHHQVDMSFAQLLWSIDEPVMRLTMPRASSIGNANFESLNFFDRNQYQAIQGMDAQHPLLMLRNFSQEYGSEEFPAEDYSRFVRRPIHQIRRQLLELTLQGFIFYDTDTDIIRIRGRLYHYLQANIRRIDYDVINFASTTNAPTDNAILNLTTNDLKINGIPRVYISNSQNVNIFPANNTVTLKGNRNFLFDGNINAGNLSFFGSNFGFNYDEFTINLQQVDSISLRARMDETDGLGRIRLTQVQNLIRNVTGELFIDRPFNKSGRYENPSYPKFSSTEMSYVFYNDRQIQNGVYRQEDFYFELDPFLMDSLNTFRNEELRFQGRLFSAGIFPVIEETLILQEDFSLGIKHIVSESGISTYGERGRWHSNISMSNSGLRGDGRLDYLTTEIYSEDFVFFPDSARTVANHLIIKKQDAGVEFPEVNSKNNPVKWLPYNDIMDVGMSDTGFDLFGGRAGLDGSLQITSGGLGGEGVIGLEDLTMSSNLFSLGSESFTTEKAGVELKIEGGEFPALVTKDISAKVDLRTASGLFSRTSGREPVFLPASSYKTDAETFKWDMDRNLIRFLSEKTEPGSGLRGSRYVSTARNQDSLSFYSPDAELDYLSNILVASEVDHIEVADTYIYPSDGIVTIGERGRLFPLENALIKANRITSYHEIKNASVAIEGKNSYTGSGYYDYIDGHGEISEIRMDTIYVNNNIETVSRGEISEKENFYLGNRFSFDGEVSLLASRRHLEFKGNAGIIHNCDLMISERLAFESVIDPVDILIPVSDRPLSHERERIYSGVVVATDSVHVYPSFLTKRRNWADQMIITAEGYLKYDDPAGKYRIASAAKLRNPQEPGNIVSLDPEKCIIRGEGSLELGVELGQLKLSATGIAENHIHENETGISGFLSLDFFMSDEAMELLAQQADSLMGSPVDSSSFYYDRGLIEILGPERAVTFRQQFPAGGRSVSLPAELDKTFVLSDVKMKWNKESRSYRSYGKIGVAYVNGRRIDKKFTGYLEITKRRSGDYLDFYIELDDNNWYYFGYTRGVMQTSSSNRQYVGIIEDLALRHRRMRVGDRETRYVYMLASDTKINQFFRTYRLHLEGQTFVVPEEELQNEDDLL